MTVTVSGQGGTDLTLSGLISNTLTFTTSNWDTAQTVTVKAGEDDDGTDDTVTLAHTATGGNYEGVSSDLTVTVTDDDRGIVLTPTALTVAEGDTTGASYTIQLATEPSQDVTVTVTGQAETDLSLTGLSETNTLTFTTSNWNAAQTVTVKAAQDGDDRDDEVTLTHTAAGGNYAEVSSDLAVTLTDDDTLGVVVDPTAITVQAGGSNSYTVVLGTLPSGDVTVTVSGEDGTDLTLNGLSTANTLIFTTANWDSPQTVGVEAADDATTAEITLSQEVSSAADSDYDTVTAPDVEVTLLAPGDKIQIQLGVDTSAQTLTVSEGDSSTYQVVLSHRPGGDVSVVVNDPTDNSDVTASPDSLTFTADNWNTAQTVTVSAAHDDDGSDESATVTHGVSGGGYDDVSAPDIEVTVTDDDRNIVFDPTSLSVEEGDTTGTTYTVKLATQPSADVTVTVSGHAGTDLTLTGLIANTLTFTTSNWNTAQTVTVKAGEDDDGTDDTVTLAHAAAGGNYAGATGDLKVTVTDDDRGIVFTPASLTVDEGDADGETYTVKLARQPSEEVTVTVSGQAGTDLMLDKTTLTFTTSNWDTAQTVTVKAGEDDDGSDDEVTLTHTAAGGNYAGATGDLKVTVTDDDRNIVFDPTSLSVEEGDADGETYTVKLATEPSAEVTVTVSGQVGTDLTLDKTTLTFTTSNWNTAQTVTVKAGEDADGTDDEVTLTHTAAGGDYEGASADLKVSVSDNDRSIMFNPASLSVEEGDTTGQSYTVKLATEPSAEVTVTVSGQVGTDLMLTGLSANTLTFTTTNWDTAQTVTVKAGEDDDGTDDSVTLTHTAAGGDYAGASADLKVTVTDDDRDIVLSSTSLSVDEGDTTGTTYTVKLATQPSADVTVTVSGHAGTDLTLTGLIANTLTFTTSNWNTAQTVTVKAGEDDDGTDDTVTLAHAAAGGNYAGATGDLKVTVTDDDRGIVFTPASLTVDEGDADGETYTVKLARQPSEEVTVTVSGQAGTDLMLDKTTLTFTTSNWDTAQTVTVKAGEDDDGSDDEVTLTHTAAGGNYAGATGDLKVTVTDDDRNIVFDPTSLSVEEGDADGETYTVKLATEPSAEVTVTVSGQAGTDLELTGLTANTLTFTTSNWDTAQTVTVKAAQDADGSDDKVTLTHTAAGGDYEGASADLKVTVTDDDRDIVLSSTSLSVDEGDTTGETYTVKLATEPSENVTVTVSGQVGTDLMLTGLSANTLTFTTSNWNTAQTVTVKAGQDDDGTDDSVTLTHAAAGGDYEGASADLKVTVADNDRSIVLTPASLTVEEGDADGETYTVKLATQPSENVTVTVSGQAGTDLELTGLTANTLTFTTSNWNTAQTVTVKAAQDADGSDDKVTLTHTAAGGDYAGGSADLKVTVTDDDRDIVLSSTSLSVEEGDADGETYTVKLATQPSENVTVTVSGQAGTDLTLNKTTLTFTASNWNTAQTVTVKAAQDADGSDDKVTLTHTAAGGDYAGGSADLKVTVTDDDRDIVLSSSSLSVEEGDADGETYTVKLATQPSENVTVTVSGQAGTDLELTGLTANTLTFTTSNWNTAQTVTVKAGQDDDGTDDSVTLTHAAAGGDYEGASADLKVTVADNDRGIVLTPASLTVEEGDADGETYTVKLATQPSEDVTVTVSGQAGTDLELTGLTANTLTFTASNWNTAQTVTVKAAQDDDGTDDSVTLTHAAAGGDYAGASVDLKVTVTDSGIDQTPLLSSVDVSFANSAQAILEGGTATIVVSLSDALAEAVTIPLTKTNQAGAGDADYSGVPVSLTFSGGDTEQSFTVSATADSEAEQDEEVVLGFGTLPEGVGQGTVSQTTITILDVPSVSFGASDYSATEGGEDAVVMVFLSETLPADVKVPLTAEGGGGATPDDWSGAPTQVTFAAGETSKTFTLVAVDDTVEDDGEMVNLGFGTLPAGLNAGSPATATVTLMNVEESMNSCDENDVWCATIYLEGWLTDPPNDIHHVVVWGVGSTGWDETDRRFTYGGIAYEVTMVLLNPDPVPNAAYNSTLLLSFRDYHPDSPPSEDHIAQWRFHVEDIQLDFGGARRLGDTSYIWLGAEFRPLSRSGTTVDLRIERIVGEDGIHHYTPVTPNSRPTGMLVVTGAPRAGNTLTMDPSGISDQDGMADSDIRYAWWVGNPPNSGSIATGATYVVQPKYEGKPIYGQITFTDDAGRREHVNSARTERVCVEGGEIEPCQDDVPENAGNAPIENTAATGKAAISGTLAVGEILTADTSDIEDVNGLTNADFAFQWSRYDGTVSTDIAGATGSSYTVTDDDIGYEIEVTVSFTDDAGFEETVTSDTVYVQPPQPLFGALRDGPENHDGSSAFTVELHFSDEVSLEFAAVRDHVLDVTGGSVTALQPSDPDSETPNMRWQITITPTGNDAVSIVLPPTTDCTDAGAVCTDNGKMLSTRLELVIPGPSSEQSSEENSAATGLLVITGTAQVGETITADTSSIADADGLDNAAFSYQWLADDAEIADATGSTYTLLTADEGKAIKVRVSFTDDEGNEETLTSGATDAVAAAPTPNSPATGAPTISGRAQVGETLTADASGIADADGLSNAQYEYQWLADDAEIADATGSTYTLLTADEGKVIKVRVSFTDDEGNEETLTSRATDAVAAAPTPNSPATGAPTISGRAQVGETLTADASGIADADGLSNAQYEYQWLADDAEIADATDSTYTLLTADEGKVIKVRVSFTDDEGNEETLASGATDAVAAAPTPNSPATGAPTISGRAQVGETLTADTSGIADADGLSNAQYEYQWLADDAEIADATDSTYTLLTADEGKVIKVRVSFTDDEGNAESLTSAATGVVDPAAPPAPQDLTAVVNQDGSITLTWTAPDDDSVTGYQILRRRPSRDETTLVVYLEDTSSTGTTYTDTNTPNGDTYVYRVKAINPAGTGEWSNYVRIVRSNE